MTVPSMMSRRTLNWAFAGLACLLGWPWPLGVMAANEGELEFAIVDKDSGQPIAARLHLRDAKGKPVIPPKTVGWHDHFAVDGAIQLKLRPGKYQFELERGPEYRIRTGHFTIERNAKDRHTEVMERFVDMSRAGWWSGDLHIHRPPAEMEVILRSEDLHIAPVITWWNAKHTWQDQPPPTAEPVRCDENRYYQLLAGEDERGGGALLFFNLQKPLDIAAAKREFPSGAKFLADAAMEASAHLDIEKPFWWDMPVWIASGQVHSIGLANNHLFRQGGLLNEAWGKPRDKVFYPDPQGNGRWSQDIYYRLLNCGLRIPPSAGSASGVLANPVGYNRVYVHCGNTLTWESWWQGLREGRVVVTNGPLLRPRVNQQLPGHVFSAAAGEKIQLSPSLDLSLRDPVDYLEIIKDGQVVHQVRLADYAKAQGKLPVVEFDQSGWLLIRAVTNFDLSYRFASSGPYYVDIGQQPRISRESAQFFLDWVYERGRMLQFDSADEREQVLTYHRRARDFWRDLVDRANSP